MSGAIASSPDCPPDAIYDYVTRDLVAILEAKQSDVSWKLASVRASSTRPSLHSSLKPTAGAVVHESTAPMVPA
jgi:hypothetical protein